MEHFILEKAVKMLDISALTLYTLIALEEAQNMYQIRLIGEVSRVEFRNRHTGYDEKTLATKYSKVRIVNVKLNGVMPGDVRYEGGIEIDNEIFQLGDSVSILITQETHYESRGVAPATAG